jgi:ABC-2 type transport system permease protein
MATISVVTTPGVRANASYRVTGIRVLRAEWAKFWSLRSSWITLGVALLFLVAVGAIAAMTYDPTGTTSDGPPGGAPRDPVGLALAGSMFASLAVGVLGVLLSAGEYSTGMIRSTLVAVPRRLPVLWSKAAIYTVMAFIVTAAGSLISFLVGTLALQGEDIALSLADPGVLRSLVGEGLYLALVGLFGVALGALARNTAGGIAILVGLQMILPMVTLLLPGSWSSTISQYLPSNAGTAVTQLQQSADSLGPWTGLAVFAIWVAVALAGAAYRLVRTDV